MTNSEITKKQRKPRKNQPDRRKAYIDACEVLFAEKGYESTTVKDIAIATNTSIGLLFKYFPKGKEEILIEVVRKRGPLSLAYMEEIFSSKGSFEEIFLKFCLFQLDYNFKHKNTQIILISQYIYNDETLKIWKEIRHERRIVPIQKFIEERKSMGELNSNINSAMAAEYIFSLVFQITFMQYIIMKEAKEKCIQYLQTLVSMICKEYVNKKYLKNF